MALLLNKYGARRRRLSAEAIKPFQIPWLGAAEAIDAAVVAVVVGTRGVYFSFGLCWEWWMMIYAVLVASVIAQLACGIVGLDNAALALYSP